MLADLVERPHRGRWPSRLVAQLQAAALAWWVTDAVRPPAATGARPGGRVPVHPLCRLRSPAERGRPVRSPDGLIG